MTNERENIVWLPSEILTGCARDGVELRLADGAISYSGDAYALEYWLPVLLDHKSALVEMLSSDAKSDGVQRCRDCKHFTNPGKTDGYCGQREDLPPAFGINHPLRRLPADNGESCRDWDAMEGYV